MLRIRTLGALSIDALEASDLAAIPRPRLALLALLAVAGERGVSREKLLAYLWPESDSDRARHALAESLSTLRRDLAVDTLVLGTAELRLNARVITSDVQQFEQALDRRALEGAVSIYNGPFLDGFELPDCPEFTRWMEVERVRLEQRYRGALEALATSARAAGHPLVAADWWRRLATVDPLSTHVALEVMNALAEGGERAAAVAYARAHERQLRDEYNARANAAVLTLAERLATPAAADVPLTTGGDAAPADDRRRVTRMSEGRGLPGVPDPSLEQDIGRHTSSRERGAMVAGRYLIERELGRGGMAAVFLARDLKHDRAVALKFVHAELADALGIERFQREIALLARLQHPHILPLYDSGEVEGSLFYVMPYVAGESLRDRLEREKQLPVDEALRITREVADALAYAHTQGVIHRDIKPENILLASGHAMLSDFGIARAVSRAAGRRLTDDGFAVGTPQYMSPEQASGDQIDGRSDLYSLACVLYEMLAGVPPFTGSSSRSILAQRFTDPPQPVRKFRSTAPVSVDAALGRALARVPADRYQTVADFAQALTLSSTRERAHGASLTERLARWRWVVLAAALGGAVALFFAFRPAPVDPNLFVVLPFVHRADAAPRLLNGDNCQQLLYEAFGRWDGVDLVDDLRAHDARDRRRAHTLTLDEALRTARSLHAGRLAWGEVSELNGDIQVHGALYDVQHERALRGYTVHIRSDLSDAQQRFVELADTLLIPLAVSGHATAPTATDGLTGTRSLPALRAYFEAHEALAAWHLDSAAARFRRAVALDPDFPHASFWLAQTLSWAGDSGDPELRSAASRAVQLSARLAARDRALATALLALAEARYPESCATYDSLRRTDSLSFAVWYGLGECRSQDALVIPDRASPSGWSFRGSYQAAVDAYARALSLLPSVHVAFSGLAYQRLPELLFTEPNRLRRGYMLSGGDTTWFAAYPTLAADTLAFVPYPFGDVTAGRVGAPASAIAAAVERGRARLLDIARSWTREFPSSSDAYETLARALESNGLLASDDDPQHAALAAVHRARALATTAAEQSREAITEVRLRLEIADATGAKALADSLLAAASDPSPEDADALKALAALTGRVPRTAELLRRAAPLYRVLGSDGQVIQPPLAVAQAARAMLAFAALGVETDSVRALRREVDRMVASYVEPARRTAVRDAVVSLPLTLAYPELGAAATERSDLGGDYLLPIQRAAARGDAASVRAQLHALDAARPLVRPGELSIYLTYQEAWLALQAGDTADAVRRIDGSLVALPTLGPQLLEYVQDAAFFVRTMALRAELAARQHDAVTAARWARLVETLWSDADPPLQPMVQRMHVLAAAAPTR